MGIKERRVTEWPRKGKISREVPGMPSQSSASVPSGRKRRGFHDLIKENPSFVFTLLVWCLISITSLMIWSFWRGHWFSASWPGSYVGMFPKNVGNLLRDYTAAQLR